MKNILGVEPPEKRHILRKKVAVAMLCLIVSVGIAGCLIFRRSVSAFTKQGLAIAAQSWNDLFTSPGTEEIVSEVDAISQSSSSPQDATNTENVTPLLKNPSAAKVFSSSKKPPLFKEAAQHNASVTFQTDKNDDVVQGVDSAEAKSDQNSSPQTSVSSVDENVETAECASSSIASSSHRVIVNEIAWMGSAPQIGETATKAANREWIELKNISGTEIDLDGWQVVNSSGKIHIVFGSNDIVPANGFFLAARDNVPVAGISPDKAYSGSLPNDGDKMFIFDPDCGISDVINASLKWPGGDNATKQTLERKNDFDWQTSFAPGGTPRMENSSGEPVVEKIKDSSTTEKYNVSIVIAGSGGGKVAIKQNGTICTTLCVGQYAAGATMTLAAVASSSTSFVGWSGGCSGSADCSAVVRGPLSIVAEFQLKTDGSLNSSGTSSTVVSEGDTATATTTNATGTTIEQTSSSSPSSSAAAAGHLIIAAIQIAGAESNNDFVKIYNPTSASVDVSGWKLRKKSSTGTDASLREFPAGNMVGPGVYFIWANGANGFAESIGANASSTGTLAANNSIALFDATGTQVDAVAWGTGINQYGEGAPYADSPIANQVLQRKSMNGVMVDTGNNTNDFTL